MRHTLCVDEDLHLIAASLVPEGMVDLGDLDEAEVALPCGTLRLAGPPSLTVSPPLGLLLAVWTGRPRLIPAPARPGETEVGRRARLATAVLVWAEAETRRATERTGVDLPLPPVGAPDVLVRGMGATAAGVLGTASLVGREAGVKVADLAAERSRAAIRRLP